MPLRIVNLWLMLGSLVIVGVMSATMLLPRPNPEYAISELPFRMGSPQDDQESSRHGRGSDGVEDQKPWAQGAPADDGQPASAPSERPADGESPPGEGQPQGGQDTARTEEGNAGNTREEGSEPAGKSNASGENESGGDGSEDTASAQPRSEEPASAQEGPGSEQPSSGQRAPHDNTAGNPARANDAGKPRTSGNPPSASRPTAEDLPRWPPDVSRFLSPDFLKWLFYGILAIVAAVVMWTHRRQLLAALGNLWQELMDLWNGLFGGKVDRADSQAEEVAVTGAARRRFVDFINPFAAGTAATWPPEELVRHTFEAVEAWAWEHGLPRQPEETPHEFARRLGAKAPSLAEDAGRLADLYCQAAYAPGTLPATEAAGLAGLWRKLTAREMELQRT